MSASLLNVRLSSHSHLWSFIFKALSLSPMWPSNVHFFFTNLDKYNVWYLKYSEVEIKTKENKSTSLKQFRMSKYAQFTKAQMFDWNVSLTPLDGAVVEKRRGGGLACALTSIKIVISNQSAHWPTIQNITHGRTAGARWVTRLKSFFTEPEEMQPKRTELHCRFYSRSVFSHLWLLRA